MDTFAPKTRSSIMRAVKSSNTKLEKLVRSALWRNGLRFRIKNKLPGKPDMVFKGAKTVIFIDSCFWHGCPEHCRMPSSNTEYWNKKIQRNEKRDNEINKIYENLDWNIIRIWEHELKTDPAKTLEKLENHIRHNYKLQ